MTVAPTNRRSASVQRSNHVQALMDLASDGIVVLNRLGEIVSWNRGAEALFGYESAQVCGGSIWAMLPSGYEQQYAAIFRGLAAQRIVPPAHPVEIFAARSDGSTFPTELSVSTWQEGRETFVLTIFRDVSERRLMEQQLRASTELFEGVLNGASQSSIIATDDRGIITVFNPGAEYLLGYEAREVVGRHTLVDFHDPAEIEARAIDLHVEPGLEVLAGAARQGNAETREWTYVRKDRERVPVSLTVTALMRDDELRGFIAVAYDLTALRRAERRTAWANEVFKVAFSSAPSPVVLTRSDATCVHASPAFCELTGFTPDQLATMSMLDLVVNDDDPDPHEVRAREDGNFLRLLTGEVPVHHSERRIRRAGGSTVWVRERTSLVTDDDGEPRLFITHLEDITEQQKLQQALREALERKVEALDRLEEIDRAKSDFVSMVGHELRSPITSIIGYLELLNEGSYGQLAPAQLDALGIVGRNAARLEQLIADLLTLSQLETGMHAELQTEEVDLVRVVRNVVDSIRPIGARRRHECLLDVDTESAVVLGDERQLEHVVTNLLTNAIKFTPEGGKFEIRVCATETNAVVSVRDNGIGIAANELPYVFRRFFRGGGEAVNAAPGTGLGLSIARAIIEQHAGRIALESTEGVGTTVTFMLPLMTASPFARVTEARREVRNS